MKFILSILLLTLTLGTALHAYDAEKAAFFHTYYQKFTQKAMAESKLFIDGEEAMNMLNGDTNPVLLDIRSEAEAAVVGLTHKNALFIPLDKLFMQEQLDKLPTDRTIILVCYSGTRAAMAATALHMSGIKNIRVLKGGLAALAKATTPITAPIR